MKKNIFFAAVLVAGLSFQGNLCAMYQPNNNRRRDFDARIQEQRDQLNNRINILLENIETLADQQNVEGRRYLHELRRENGQLIPYYIDFADQRTHYRDENNAIDLQENDTHLIGFFSVLNRNQITPSYMDNRLIRRRNNDAAIVAWYDPA